MLRYRGHIGWNSWKIIPRLISLTYSLSADHSMTDLLQSPKVTSPNFSRNTYAVGSGRIKLAISPKRLKIERKLLLKAYIKSYSGFRLPTKCMTLNNLWARFKVTDSLNAAKMAKYSLLMTPTPCRVAGCITWPLLGLRIHAPVHSLTQLARRI